MSGRPSIAGFLRENEDEALIQRVMASEHVSIQVARNLLKAGKLGVGPGAKYVGPGAVGSSDSSDRDRGGGRREWEPRDSRAPREFNDPRDKDPSLRAPPPKFDRKSAAQAMAEKLKKLQEEQEEQEDELAQQKRKQVMARKQGKIGIAKLGPVSAREEEVDPLKIKIAAIKAREAEAPEDKDQKEGEEEDDDNYDYVPDGQGPRYERAFEAPRVATQDELRRQHKEERKKKRQLSANEMKQRGDADGHDSEDERPWKRPRANEGPGDQNKGSGKGAASSSGGGGGGGGGSSGGLMSEAEARKMIHAGKKNDVARGSIGAAARIQKELAEWERDKAKNPEFWKPPKFCLVLGSGRR